MKYIIGGFGVIIVVATFIAIVMAFIGRDPVSDEGSPDDRISTLSDLANESSEVSYTTLGPIVGQEDFRAIRITVSDSRRTLEILTGYNLSTEETVDLSNNTAAYEAFLNALEEANFTAVLDGVTDTEDGKCATNRRHVYSVVIDGEEDVRTWSSPCRGEQGNFGGNPRLVERLFQAQIPDYRDLTREYRL